MMQDPRRAALTPMRNPTERRRQIRQFALLRVALLHADGISDICVVKNISPNGLSARVYRKLVPDAAVQIEFRSGELLAGTIVWEDEHDVGIIFPEPINVAAVLASPCATDAAKRRALPRIAVECRGLVHTELRSINVQLQDISQAGANLETDHEVPDRCKIRLSLPNLPPIAGVVRWRSGKKVGVSFNQCIGFEPLARWIQARREGLGLARAELDGAAP